MFAGCGNSNQSGSLSENRGATPLPAKLKIKYKDIY